MFHTPRLVHYPSKIPTFGSESFTLCRFSEVNREMNKIREESLAQLSNDVASISKNVEEMNMMVNNLAALFNINSLLGAEFG